MVDKQIAQALIHKLTAVADDELVLAHRNAEWIGHAPILEEDIALANIAQDELGHATVWYGLIADLTDEDPDELVYFRDAAEYRNVQLVELPKGDWAFTMLRQYLFDAYEMTLLTQLATSQYQPIVDATAKIRNEEMYHLRHTSVWVQRLGLGTAESQQRMQAALNVLWRYTAQLFMPLPDEALLVAAGIVPNPDELRQTWQSVVIPHLQQANLIIPDASPHDAPLLAQRSQHSEHLTALLADLQQVARLDPEAEW